MPRIVWLHVHANTGTRKMTMAKKTKAPEVPTLKDLCFAYLASIQMDGRTSGTAASYANDLNVATKFFGEDATLLEMTRDRISEFFHCDAVTKNRKGEPKNAISIAKTRRVLMLAFDWAIDSGWPDAPMGITIAATAETAGIETTVTDSEPQLPSFDHPELTHDESTTNASVEIKKHAKKNAKKGGKKAKATVVTE